MGPVCWQLEEYEDKVRQFPLTKLLVMATHRSVLRMWEEKRVPPRVKDKGVTAVQLFHSLLTRICEAEPLTEQQAAHAWDEGARAACCSCRCCCAALLLLCRCCGATAFCCFIASLRCR
mgnify:CR=1 FL=1